MPVTHLPDTAPAGAPFARTPHPLLRRLRRAVRRAFRAGDPVLVRAGVAGERALARARLWLFVGLLLVPAAELAAGEPMTAWERRALLGYPVAAVCVAALIDWRARRARLPRWFGLLSGAVDMTLVTAALAGFCAAGQPFTAVNSGVTFELYFLGLAATTLRYDWRVCALAGALGVAGYAGVCAWAAAAFDLSDAASVAAGYGTFSWSMVAARGVLLALAAALAGTFVVRSARLRVQSVRDRLTGLTNRAYFDERLAEAFELRARTGEPVAAVLLDVDHFKQVNDRHGHAVGDAVLRAVAATLRAHARGSDVLARHGGEEFALLLPGATGEAALARAEALRAAVGALRVTAGGAEGLGVTASAGVACTEEAGMGDAVALMHRADQRLYQAKREGRDRVAGAGGRQA